MTDTPKTHIPSRLLGSYRAEIVQVKDAGLWGFMLCAFGVWLLFFGLFGGFHSIAIGHYRSAMHQMIGANLAVCCFNIVGVIFNLISLARR